MLIICGFDDFKKVQVGKDQEKAQSEKYYHFKLIHTLILMSPIRTIKIIPTTMASSRMIHSDNTTALEFSEEKFEPVDRNIYESQPI